MNSFIVCGVVLIWGSVLNDGVSWCENIYGLYIYGSDEFVEVSWHGQQIAEEKGRTEAARKQEQQLIEVSERGRDKKEVDHSVDCGCRQGSIT